MKHRQARALALGVTLALAAPAAVAQETVPPPPEPEAAVASAPSVDFGLRGQIAVSTDLRLSAIRLITTMGGGSSTDFTFQPAADVFITPRFSVGGLLYYRLITAMAGDTTIYGLEPRAGYSVRLSDSISFWPRAGVGYFHARLNDLYNYQLRVSVRAHVIWHPTSHVFIGAGPVFQRDLISQAQGMDGAKTTLFGLSSIIGAYFGGG